jgi:hypothetical protein
VKLPGALRTFNEIGNEINSVIAELKARDLKVEVYVHRHNNGYLLPICGWFVTISWQPRGLPEDSHISIHKWRGRPNVPGLPHSIDQALAVAEWRYHYGLARINEVGWIAPEQPDVALSTRAVLERLFTELFTNPNKDPAPVYGPR